MLIARRNLMAGKSLPYLRRVAYLESHGTEWIDTGIIPAIGMSFDFEIARMMKNNTVLWGVRYGGTFSGNKQCYLNWNAGSTNNRLYLFCENTELSYGWNDESVYGEMMNYADANVSDLFDNHCDRTITLFAFRNINSVNTSLGVSRQRRWAVKENGLYIRDLVAVLSLDGEPCMYDEATGRGGMNHDGTPRDDGLYFNQGTGTFGYADL